MTPAEWAEKFKEVVDKLDVEHNHRYQPSTDRDGSHVTFCNFYVADFIRELNIKLPLLLANAQIDWLNTVGVKYGWLPIKHDEAAREATEGPVVAGFRHLPHGHIAVVWPGMKDVLVSQAGAKCHRMCRLEEGFGKALGHPAQQFWRHRAV